MPEKMKFLLITKIKLILPYIVNDQLNDKNINKAGTSKSFFRMKSSNVQRSYDKSNKVLSLSQSQSDQRKENTRNNS